MTVDCQSPKHAQEQQLCACMDATDAMMRLVNAYEGQVTDYAKQCASYNRWKERHNDWKNMRNDFSWLQEKKQRLRDEQRQWNNCVDGNLYCGFRKNDQWCQNDIGEGWHQAGCEQSDCGLYRKGVCKRESWLVDRDMQKDVKESEPSQDTQTGVTWLGVPFPEKPLPPPASSILCCSQVFTDIVVNNGDLDIGAVTQNCSQKLEDKLQRKHASEFSGTSSSPAASDNKLENQMYSIIVVVLCMLLCVSVLIGVVGVQNGMKG